MKWRSLCRSIFKIKLKNFILIFFWYSEIIWKWQDRKLDVKNWETLTGRTWSPSVAQKRKKIMKRESEEHAWDGEVVSSCVMKNYESHSNVRSIDRSDFRWPRLPTNARTQLRVVDITFTDTLTLEIFVAGKHVCNIFYIVSAPNCKLMLCKTNASLLRLQSRRPRATGGEISCDHD